jgi:hypothetical protein
MERLFRQKPTNPWAGFDIRYPKATGYIELGVPAFSEDGSHAIVYCAHHWGLLAAHGDMALLEWTGSQWVIVSRQELWIS